MDFPSVSSVKLTNFKTLVNKDNIIQILYHRDSISNPNLLIAYKLIVRPFQSTSIKNCIHFNTESKAQNAFFLYVSFYQLCFSTHKLVY